MIERDKQKDDQKKKHTDENENRDLSKQDVKVRPKQKHAGMATDPQTMKDKDYIKDIEEKTKKH